jgi:hypothetical protein
VRDALVALLRDPAGWAFLAVWMLAAAYLVVIGQGDRVVSAILNTDILFVIFGGVTIALTTKAPAAEPVDAAAASRPGRWRLPAQIGVLLVAIVLTGYRGMVFNHALPRTLDSLSVWTPVVDALDGFWRHVFAIPSWGTNPTLYVIVPGLCLLALGARWRSLGFARGYRSWLIALLWGSIQIIGIIVALAMGRYGVLTLLRYFVSNLLQNGFSEEFLFRGALLTRLKPLLGTSWAVVLSSLVFGLWHLGVDTAGGGNYLAGAAVGILSQGTFGLAMAIVFLRTRNLLAPTILHILFDTPTF